MDKTIKLEVYDKLTAQEDEDVKKEVQKVAEQLGDDRRILLRRSGTEPVVRVMVKAGTDEICRACCDQVIAVMRRKGHIID